MASGSSAKNLKDVMKEMKQMDTRIQSLNKEKDAQLYKKSPALASELIDMDNKLNSDFARDRIKTRKEIYQLRAMVTRFHSELKNVQPTPEFLEKLKVIMEEIESSISLFKESQRETYEELMLAEVQHSHEINALDKRFDSWSESDLSTPATRGALTKLPSARDVAKNLPPEVAQFSKFLEQTGGARGGWDEYDHNTFLKWRIRHKGKQQFISEAISHLPTKTAEEVTSHETWYREFLHLQDLKRLAIKAWKQKKNEEKIEMVGELDDDSDEEAEKRAEKQRQIFEKERQERQKRLGSWKLEKELERAEAEERRLREEREKKEKEKAEKLRQQELRGKVSQYKRSREQEEEMLRLEMQAREMQERRELRERQQQEKGRIELRNHLALEQKTKHVRETERKRQQQLKREEKLKAQYEVNVARDPNRLLQPTAGWKSRTMEVGASAEAGRVYTMSHRAVPSWRRGV